MSLHVQLLVALHICYTLFAHDKLMNWTTYSTIKAYGQICYYNAHEAHTHGKSTTCMYCIDQFNMGAQW